jgi:hypothetical protein
MRESPNPIEVELAAEKAAALGRSARRLRAALDKLRRFDAGESRPRTHGRPDDASRRELVELAGEALWAYVVHRESLGLHDEETVVRDHDVPNEVRKHMGPRLRRSRR